MILTGSEIAARVSAGEIVIDPFFLGQLNPNSYNYRLGDEVLEVVPQSDGYRSGETGGQTSVRHIPLEKRAGRYLLQRGHLYLGHTLERVGSSKFVTSLIGRSSIGRLGLFVQLSADLGHCGDIHRWTLELFPTLDIYLYPGQNLGQVSFWTVYGETKLVSGWYGRHDHPMPSKLHSPAQIPLPGARSER